MTISNKIPESDAVDDIEAVKRDTETLRTCFIALVLVAASYALHRCRWEATIQMPGGGIGRVQLPAAPIWNPPPAPVPERLVERFSRLHVASDLQSPAEVSLDVFGTFLIFAMWYWLICVVTSIIYATLRRRVRDPLLDVAWWTAISVTASASGCMTLYLALGGWGPPSPEFFSLLGVFAGPLIAWFQQPWTGLAAEILAEKRGDQPVSHTMTGIQP